MAQSENLFGDSPFYPTNVPSSKLAEGTVVTTKSVGPEQKTLDQWHYKLNEAIEDLRDVGDPVTIRRDLEDIANEIQTYLKG